MTITFDVPLEMERRVREEAAVRGLDTEAFLKGLLQEALDKELPAGALSHPRIPGLNAGQILISDDFDAPLPDSFWLGTDSESQ
jgi:hypothetical protein